MLVKRVDRCINKDFKRHYMWLELHYGVCLVVKSSEVHFGTSSSTWSLSGLSQAVSDVTLPRALKVRPSVCVATSVRRHLWIIRTTCSYFPGTEPLSSELGEIKTGTSLSVMNHCLKMWRRLRNAGRIAPQQKHKGGLLLVVSYAVFLTLLWMLLNRSVML